VGSALDRNLKTEQEARKITVVALFHFYCELTKSREPISESSFREYALLEGALLQEAKDELGAFFKTEKRCFIVQFSKLVKNHLFIKFVRPPQ
jgi:hypothetical protein